MRTVSTFERVVFRLRFSGGDCRRPRRLAQSQSWRGGATPCAGKRAGWVPRQRLAAPSSAKRRGSASTRRAQVARGASKRGAEPVFGITERSAVVAPRAHRVDRRHRNTRWSAPSLPAIGAGIPLALRLDTNGQSNTTRTAAFALALLDGNALQSDDWNGDLALSLQRGLERFAGTLPHFGFLRLRLWVSDYFGDSASPYPACDWRRGDDANTERRPHWGMFGLLHNPYDDLPIASLRPRCAQLDGLVRGAGTALFVLVSHALKMVGGWTPDLAAQWWDVEFEMRTEQLSELEMNVDIEPDAQEFTDDYNEFAHAQEKLEGFPSPQEFRAKFPRASFAKRLPQRVICAAPSKLPASAPALLRRAAQIGVELLHALRAGAWFWADNCDFIERFTIHFGAEKVLPCVVSWDEYDEAGRLSDEYLEKLGHEWGSACEVLWCACFDPLDGESVKNALVRLGLVCRVLQLADDLITLLNTDVPPDERSPAKSLLDVLAADAPNEPAPFLAAL